MMMCYTDFVVTPLGQFKAGWIHIGILVTQIFCNFMFVFLTILNTFKLLIIKAYRWFMYDEQEAAVQVNALKALRREEK